MSQESHTLSYAEKFLTMQMEVSLDHIQWLQSWSRQLPEFQRIAIKHKQTEIMSALDSIGAPSLIDTVEFSSENFGLHEDFESDDLRFISSCSLWLANIDVKKLCIQDKLKLAIAMTEAISLLHKADIFHFSLRPGCFLVSENFDHAEIIDFSEAKFCSRQSQGVTSFVPSIADPYFLSPEQSYLHERLLDNRSDLYSLGCILYWLLSGEAPFLELKETAKVSYAHMSQSLTLPLTNCSQSNKEIGFTEVIEILLKKEPEKRYQSSAGILADLKKLSTLEKDNDFITSAHDICDRMVIPQRLYGRQKETKKLMQLYKRAASGHSEALLIAGYSGIGKSALVDEVRIPIMQENGLFVFGKFEQYQRETPYSAISQAFNRFINLILSHSEAEVINWKKRLLNALGNNAQVIIDIIPSLSQLLGDVPTPQSLGPDEQQNRFNNTFLTFVRHICQVHKPLVLFIDDLQWADSASINLLQLILSDKENQYCFIIGAYRDNEIDERHPFTRMLGEVEDIRKRIHKIKLESLEQDIIAQIIADTLKRPTEEILELTHLIYEKTAGNPFFFRQFVFELYRTKLLNFQYNSNIWHWSIEEIKLQSITDNVVDLVTVQLERLSTPNLKLLQQAACIGSIFSTNHLQSINSLTLDCLQSMLKECIDAGLIRALTDSAYNHPDHCSNYAFVHDRIQQAAYAQNTSSERQQVHYYIGSLLLDQLSDSEILERCFELVAHLNSAQALLSPLQMSKTMELNYLSAQKAKSATAYKTAISYLDSVLDYDKILSKVVDEDIIETKIEKQILKDKPTTYKTALATIEKLECLYLAGDYESAELFKPSIYPLCNDIALKVQLASILVTQYTRYGQLQRAIDEGLKALTLLSWPLPESPSEEDIGAEIAYSQSILAQSGFEQIAQKQDIDSDKILLTLDILMAMQPCCYNSGSLLFPLTILSLFRLTEEHGNSPYSSYVFMMYALLCTKALKNYPLAFEAAKHSKLIAKRYPPNPVLEGRLLMMNSNFVLPWQTKLQQSHDMRNQAYHLCLEHGDYYWGVHSYIFGFYADLISSSSIADLLTRSRTVVSTCELIKQPAQTYLSTLQCNFLEILQGSLDNLHNLDHQTGYEAKALQHFIDNHYMCGSYDRLLARLLQGYLFNNYQQALSISLAEDLGPEQIDEGIFHEAVYTLFNLLCILALKQTNSEQLSPHYQEWFKQGWEKYQLWYQINPDNFEAGYYLISAEIAAANKDKVTALCCYEKSITSASQSGFALYEALACERSGRYRLHLEQITIATGYLQQAQAVYHSWGAHAKAMDIEDLLNTLNQKEASLENHHPNWESVVSASQDISSPLSRKELNNRMLQRAATTTGAQRVGLYLKQAGIWHLSASCVQGEIKEVSVQPEHMPASILNYCLNSRNTIVLKDAHIEGEYVLDDYIHINKVRSVLSLPLQVRDEIVGVLYLEHNEASNLFTGQRRQVMELLKTQFAITYQNAELFLQLEHQNEALEKIVSDRTMTLNRQNKHLELILNALPIPYVLSKPNGELIGANDLFFDFFEITRSEFKYSSLLDFYLYSADREEMLISLDKDGIINDFECEMKTYKGKSFWAQFSVTRIEFESGPGIFTAIKDISGRKQKEILLEQQASTDPLTGVYNRRGFDECSNELMAGEKTDHTCVVMLDLDKFKILNDTYGHAAGDEVLKHFSLTIQSHLRDQDILGRIGGEEFAIVLPGLTLTKAQKMMQRICTLTSQTPIIWQSERINITVSIGISAWNREEPLTEVCKRADSALYQAKEAGRNCIKLS